VQLQPVLPPHPQPQYCFCVLNAPNRYYKITPDLWKVWMRIMRAVPSTRLWLIKFDAVDGPKNLKRECEAEGVDFSRIVISDMFPREREFLIKGLADLFLDTPEFNAHTTATDALWAGVPIVSLPGVNLAQRVAGSLCKDAGLSHLLVRLALFRNCMHVSPSDGCTAGSRHG
jgi:protein O-GlcNAc transferase